MHHHALQTQRKVGETAVTATLGPSPPRPTATRPPCGRRCVAPADGDDSVLGQFLSFLAVIMQRARLWSKPG